MKRCTEREREKKGEENQIKERKEHAKAGGKEIIKSKAEKENEDETEKKKAYEVKRCTGKGERDEEKQIE